MLQSIWNDIKQEFDYGNTIKRIIIVNIAVYVVINLIWVFLTGTNPGLYQGIVNFFSISSDWWHVLTHPWSVLTHMFLHEGFWHILWNMLFLFWFGRIFGDLLGDRRVLPLYILGGLAGAAVYFIVGNLGFIPVGGYALGASAAVMAIIVAAGVFAPNYGIHLLFIGEVKLKWIVMAMVFMNILGTQGAANVGGAWGHLGGIAMGFVYALQLQKGNDLSAPIQRSIQWVIGQFNALTSRRKQQSRPGPRPAYRRGEAVKTETGRQRNRKGQQKGNTGASSNANSHQEQLDAILDKIKDQGYNSLSAEEKDFLFRASNK